LLLAIAEEVLMRRRDIIAGLLVAAAFGGARAQPTATKIPRIGYLGTNIGLASLPPIEAFRQGLRQLGYIEGQNIVVEYRWASGQADPLAAAKAAELVRLDLDLIVAANHDLHSFAAASGQRRPNRILLQCRPRRRRDRRKLGAARREPDRLWVFWPGDFRQATRDVGASRAQRPADRDPLGFDIRAA
jgi:hypothetical protein